MIKLIVPLISAMVIGCASANTKALPSDSEPISRVSVGAAPGHMGNVQLYNEPGVSVATLSAPIDSVWLVLPTVYELLGIPDVSVDREELVVGNPNFRARRIEGERLSRYFDCGMGVTAVPNADNYQMTLSALTQVASAEDGTQLTVTVNATGRPRSVSGNPVHCQSKGLLERRIIELVELVLAGGEAR